MGKKRQSIVQDLDEYRCFNCGREYGLEIHHCWHGFANRRLADEDGLVIWLCQNCHRALHDRDTALDKDIQKKAEMAWIAHGNGDIKDFIHRYGKNVLEINI